MKKSIIILSLLSLTFVSCNKHLDEVLPQNDSLKRTFSVSIPETKTTIDGLQIKWAAGDQIRVLGYSEGSNVEQAVFTIKSGAGSRSAVFEINDGQSLGDFDKYYAVYPSDYEIDVSKLPSQIAFSSSGGKINLTALSAIENGFDPKYGVMTAVSNASGELVFRHGVAYIKLQIPADNITAVSVKFSNNATGTRPIYDASNGLISSVEGGASEIKATGVFIKDSYYYLPAPARASNPGDVTITYTRNGSDYTITTSSLSKVRLETGNVWDLGCPPINLLPKLSASDTYINSDVTSGAISYTIQDEVPSGILVASVDSDYAPVEGSDLISNLVIGSTSNGQVSFTCDENDGNKPRECKVILTYSYDEGEDVVKEVMIYQDKPGGSIVSNTYSLYMTSSGVVKDDYFTSSTGSITLSASTTNGCGVDSFIIDGVTYTHGLKLDGSGHVTFTTHSTYNTSVSLYYSKRASGSGKIKITPTGGTATVFEDASYGSLSSHTVQLEKSTEYKIQRDSGELVLIYVKVNETNN